MSDSVANTSHLIPKPDNLTILALHEAGKSARQIEAILGNIDHATICRRLKHLTPRKTTNIYKQVRADVFAEKQRKLLMRSDKADAKTQRDIATCVGIYYDKERLERGLSSANLSVQIGLSDTISQSVSALISRLPGDIQAVEQNTIKDNI